MTTLGAKGCPALWGVPGPAPPALLAPPMAIMPCCAPNCEPLPNVDEAAVCPGCNEVALAVPSLEDEDLVRESANWVCDDDGVP